MGALDDPAADPEARLLRERRLVLASGADVRGSP